jgi:GlpG protein
MRQAGTVPTQREAERYADYLLTEGIATRIDSEGEQFAIWVRDEQYVSRSRELLEEFLRNPEDPRYAAAHSQAESLRRDEDQQQREYQKKVIDVRRNWEWPTLSRCRVTLGLMVLAVLCTLWSNFGKDPAVFQWLYIGGGLGDILKSGQLWRLVTPVFVHMDLLHLLFNLYWTYQFGLLIESRRGSWRFLGLVLFVAVVSNLAQYYASGPVFGGLSGIGYGLFGYLWIKSRFDPAAGMQIPPNLVLFFLIWLVVCALGWFGSVANTAHFVGLLAGIAVAGARLLVRR